MATIRAKFHRSLVLAPFVLLACAPPETDDGPASTPRADEKPPQNVIDDYSGVSGWVAPRWKDGEAKGPLEKLVLEGTVHNVMAFEVEVEVVAVSRSPVDEIVETEVAGAKLQPGETLKVGVPASKLPWPTKGVETEVVLAARYVVDPQEPAVEVRLPRRVLELLDEKTALARPHERIANLTDALARATLRLQLEEGQKVVAGGDRLVAPGGAVEGPGFPVDVKLCTSWGVSYDDTDPQQAYLGQTGLQHPDASYARIIISEPSLPWPPYTPGTTVYKGYLDPYGCTEWLSLPTGAYAFALETRFRKGSLKMEVQYDEDVYGYSPGTLHVYGSTGTVHRPTFEDDRAERVAAILSRALITEDLPFDDNGHVYEAYADAPCPSDPTIRACGGTNEIHIADNYHFYDLTRARHVVGHEFGHSVQRRGIGTLDLTLTDYADGDSSVVACSCDHVMSSNRTHCLQSREELGVAFAEGFAHFVATRLFNDSSSAFCRFDYYKEFREDSGTVVPAPYRLNCGFPIDWMKTHGCQASDMPTDPPDGGTEYDWMDFLWTITRPSPDDVSLAELFDVLKHACTGPTCDGDTLTWEEIADAVASSTTLTASQKTNFAFAATLFGVEF